MPNILTGLSSSKTELAMQTAREAESAIRAQREDLERAFEIWDAYFAVGGRQWDKTKRAALKEEDRHPWQFDIIGPKTDALASSLVADLPSIDWTPVFGEKTTGTEAIRETYLRDKELFNYGNVYTEVFRDGCVHAGWMQMTVSKKYNPHHGNIKFERVRPGCLIQDPYWKTDDDRDQECCYKVAYMTAEKMADFYDSKTEDIMRAVRDTKEKGRDFGNSFESQDREFRAFNPRVSDEYRVIEKHFIETVKRERLVGMKVDERNGAMVAMPFPVTDDRDLLDRFRQFHGIDWLDVIVQPYSDKVHKVRTITDLASNILLEDGKSVVQCMGLPFFLFTCARYNGHNKGIAESILDAQRIINEKESLILNIIDKASGGSEVWNENLFSDPKQQERFSKNRNKHGHIEFADLDNVSRIKEQVTPAQVPNAVFSEINRMYEQVIPLVSRVSDTMSAMSSPEDSGVMIERKYQMNRIANILYEKQTKQFLNNVGEAYFYQWKETYADAEIEMTTKNGKVTLNQKSTDSLGNPVVINSVTATPRCRVIVTESRNSDTWKMRKRVQFTDVLKSIPPQDNLRMQFALGHYFSSLDLPEEEERELASLNEMEMSKAIMQYVTEMSGFDAQLKGNTLQAQQAEQMIAQMQVRNQPQNVQQQVTPMSQPQAGGGQPQVEQQMTPDLQQQPEMAVAGGGDNEPF